jgi:hypothetical protein
VRAQNKSLLVLQRFSISSSSLLLGADIACCCQVAVA